MGADGETHQGVFDVAFLRHIPNLVLMMPKDENELRHMMKTALDYDDGPIAYRYPRINGLGVPLDESLCRYRSAPGKPFAKAKVTPFWHQVRWCRWRWRLPIS